MASLIKWDSPQVTKKGALVAKRASGNQQIEELLDAIVPPKSYATDDGSLWQQRISATPATKMDVTRLHESLDQQLLQRQARETGVCPVREGLYREAYDEVIRQTAVSSAERGTLLLRVRNEVRMRVAAYQTLYESSIAYGMRKALLAEQKRGELQAKILLCTAELGDLEKTAAAIEARIASLEAVEKERGAADEEKHATEVAKLQAGNVTLKEELEMLLAPPRK